MKILRFALVAAIAVAFFASWSDSTHAATMHVTANDRASTNGQDTPVSAATDSSRSALCEIVYQVDQEPSPTGYRYLFYGNGFFINKDGYVLTAAHVLSELNGGQPYVLLHTKQGVAKFVEADVVTIDHDHDIAILRPTPNPFTSGYDVSFLPLATESLMRGQSVFAAALRPVKPRDSYTGDPIVEQHSQGAVLEFDFSRFEDSDADTELFVFSHPVQPGQSGAAVLSSQSHAVVGLVEGEWLRGALTALAAAKHGGADDDADLLPGDNSSPIPGAVIPIHYAISLLQQNGIAWQSASTSTSAGEGAGTASEPLSEPAPLSLVPAPFPSQSFFGGEVLLDVQVDATGTTSDANVIRGDEPFLSKALAAVHTWTFLPAHVNGHAVAKRVTVAFEFPQPYIPPRADTIHDYSSDMSSGESGATRPLKTVEPSYPNASVKGGSVILYGTIQNDGEVGSIRALRGPEDLSSAAMTAVQGWKFAPAKGPSDEGDSTVIIAVAFRQPLVVNGTRQGSAGK